MTWRVILSPIGAYNERALRQGHAFIGNDLPAPTRGFRFYAQGRDARRVMGDDIDLHESVTFQIKLPTSTECRLIRNGEVVKAWHDRPICAYIARQPGIYRVEVYINYMGRKAAAGSSATPFMYTANADKFTSGDLWCQ
jgi:hypothetical protein